MTLHEAIKIILQDNDNQMTSTEIANELNKRNLYQRKDKGEIPASQIATRINKYPTFFAKIDDKISLIIDK